MQKNYKALMEKNQEALNKWRVFHVHGSERPSIDKMSILLNLIYRYNTIPVKIPASSFGR